MTSYYYSVKTLLENNINKLPIVAKDIELILLRDGWEVMYYDLNDSQSLKILERLNVLEDAKKRDGFSLKIDDVKIVFIRRTLSTGNKIFVLAHELGHIRMAHFSDTGILGKSAGYVYDDAQEIDANGFARYFLSPPRVLKRLNVKNTDDIKRYTLLNDDMAKIQAVECKEIKGELTNDEYRLLSNFSSYIDSQTLQRKTKRQIAGILSGSAAICVALCVITLNIALSMNIEPDETYLHDPIATPATIGDQAEVSGKHYSLDFPVYRVTSGTEVFHKAGCSYISKSKDLIETTINEALEDGLRPCSRCFK